MASIKAIESSSVHRIQSGQVIVDLCSVVKELVENSIDAGATSVEVRFKNNGLDSVEVVDNGSGIAKEDYESVALKHYTSKLRSYNDLSALDTFGFRGEALSSLCALSDVRIITAQEAEAPKGTVLHFTPGGALKDTSTVAAQRGTTVSIETIFKNLPVRRQELTKNIKREYTKVIGLLHAYACISVNARVSVSNIAANGKKTIVFSTKAKQSTRDNIANVFGTKTTAMLIPLDLDFHMQPTAGASGRRSDRVHIVGHVSRPVVGEGRQTPDKQMFFVNGRPCMLPQLAKVMNEVYKTYNLNQSPFIFADVQLDTNGYDVNVSPDKRTIMLHEQGELLESLRESLTQLFDNQRQTVPQAKGATSQSKLPAFTPLVTTGAPLVRQDSEETSDASRPRQSYRDANDLVPDVSRKDSDNTVSADILRGGQGDLVKKLFTHKLQDRSHALPRPQTQEALLDKPFEREAVEQEVIEEPERLVLREVPDEPLFVEGDEGSSLPFSDHSIRTSSKTTLLGSTSGPQTAQQISVNVLERSADHADDGTKSPAAQDEPEMQGQASQTETPAEVSIASTQTSPMKAAPGPVQNAFDRMRPFRTPTQKATITIGDQTTTATIGSSSQKLWSFQQDSTKSKTRSRVIQSKQSSTPSFQSSLRAFAAPGSQFAARAGDESSDDGDEGAVPVEPPLGLRRQARRTGEVHEEPEDAEDISDPDDGPVSPEEPQAILGGVTASEDDSDEEYLDEEAKKQKEDARVARLIREAEERAAPPNEEGVKRAGRLLKDGHQHATSRLELTLPSSTEEVLKDTKRRSVANSGSDTSSRKRTDDHALDASSAEEQLSLTVSKEDFSQMKIAGQFNLGFIIALRQADNEAADSSHTHGELFIIDQHASDEKFNFERLQATTIVQNQPLVHKQTLDLTAIEEEIILENQDALRKNGFEIEFDESGSQPVGKRCTLTKIPMSKEVTFSTRDLEELLALLAESPSAPTQAPIRSTQRSLSLTVPSPHASFLAPVVRPSAVRKMFAMRACRSSVMIGKTLNRKQMQGLVTNMGKMEKPWNCPHGRPTMRHLYSFGQWTGWSEGDGVGGMSEDDSFAQSDSANGAAPNFASWLGLLSSDASGDEVMSTSDEAVASSLRDESCVDADINPTQTQPEVDDVDAR